jgi:hypothetical protein
MKSFRLAPMSTDLRIMTVVVLLLPFVLGGAGLLAPGPIRWVLLGVTGFTVLLYLSTWLWWRPSRFEITGQGLSIIWPLRSSTTPAHAIRDAVVLGRADFRRDYGYGMRVGVGGLWGGFGLLVTGKGTLSMYISRTDAFVLIHREGDRPLLITPDEPERFLAELKTAIPPR